MILEVVDNNQEILVVVGKNQVIFVVVDNNQVIWEVVDEEEDNLGDAVDHVTKNWETKI